MAKYIKHINGDAINYDTKEPITFEARLKPYQDNIGNIVEVQIEGIGLVRCKVDYVCVAEHMYKSAEIGLTIMNA